MYGFFLILIFISQKNIEILFLKDSLLPRLIQKLYKNFGEIWISLKKPSHQFCLYKKSAYDLLISFYTAAILFYKNQFKKRTENHFQKIKYQNYCQIIRDLLVIVDFF